MATSAERQAQIDLRLLIPKPAGIAGKEEVRPWEAQLVRAVSDVLALMRNHNSSVPDIDTRNFSVTRAGNVVVIQTTDRGTGEEVLVTYNYVAGTVSAYCRAGKFVVG